MRGRVRAGDDDDGVPDTGCRGLGSTKEIDLKVQTGWLGEVYEEVVYPITTCAVTNAFAFA